jgi:arylsulfatase A-like enzyme
MRNYPISIKNALGILGVSLMAGCTGSNDSSGQRPNILWISLDDGRADVLGCYDAPWANTPNIDRLAAEGVRFHDAIVQNPVCIPSRNSMKTGYYAYEAGPVEMGKLPEVKGDYIDPVQMKKINSGTVLLDAWTEVGMKPVNIGKVHAKSDRFDHRGDVQSLVNGVGKPTPFFKSKFGNIEPPFVNSEKVLTRTHKWLIGGILDVEPEVTETWRLMDTALEVLDELVSKKSPFFLRVSFHAPHVGCYVPKEYFIDPSLITLPLPEAGELELKPEFEKGPLNIYAAADLSREQIDLARGTYFGMIALVDVQVGRIIQALKDAGLYENTIIAFTSDQGFQLGEHGLWKKRVFYEGNVRTPFILRYPKKLPKNKVIQEPVELVDFIPTLMELSGLIVPAEIRGKSLMPLIDGKVKHWRQACFSEIDHSQSMYDELRQGTGRRVMVRTSEWKMVFFMDSRVKDKDGALYNLKSDPGEKVNLYNDPQYKEVIANMEQLAERWTKGENLFAH